MVEPEVNSITLTHIHDRTNSWLATGTLIKTKKNKKTDVVKLVLWSQAFPLGPMMRSKCEWNGVALLYYNLSCEYPLWTSYYPIRPIVR